MEITGKAAGTGLKNARNTKGLCIVEEQAKVRGAMSKSGNGGSNKMSKLCGVKRHKEAQCYKNIKRKHLNNV